MNFQHLETIIKKQDVIVVGRTESNESIAVILNDVKPFLIVDFEPSREERITELYQKNKFLWLEKKKV